MALSHGEVVALGLGIPGVVAPLVAGSVNQQLVHGFDGRRALSFSGARSFLRPVRAVLFGFFIVAFEYLVYFFNVVRHVFLLLRKYNRKRQCHSPVLRHSMARAMQKCLLLMLYTKPHQICRPPHRAAAEKLFKCGERKSICSVTDATTISGSSFSLS